MRAERWWQDTSIVDVLVEQPNAFEFIQATRLLRHAEAPHTQKEGDWAKQFKFHSSLNLNFPNAEIESLTLDEEKIHLTNLMIGLTGIQGTLPYSYTNKIKQSARIQRNETLHFLGLFNHKLTAQYVDASLAYHLPIRYEIEQENHYLDILHALNGYVSAQHEQQDLDDYFAEFAGLMQGQNNTSHALKTMLSCVFKQPFKIKEFIEEVFHLSPEQRSTLGGNANQLGINTFCGENIRQIDGKIEIEVGPVSYTEYLKFLPDQAESIKLKRLLASWLSPTLGVDLRIILRKDDIQPIQLSSTMTIGLSQGAFLMPMQTEHNHETCYTLMGMGHA